MPCASELFQEAYNTINGPRRASYGSVQESFEALAQALGVVLRHKLKEPLTASEACQCMLALKLVRESNQHSHDNLVDLCGYAGLLAELEASL